MKNVVFISHAKEDKEIASSLANAINKNLGEYFHCALVVDRHEGDTTFTENVIDYFRTCNVFIVLLTQHSIKHQFVNQEWGYAKALKELGQIQVIQHITEKYATKEHIPEIDGIEYSADGRIKSRGFISENMMFIDLVKDEKGDYLSDDTVSRTIHFLEKKKEILKPIYTEVQQKLERLKTEYDKNSELLQELFDNRENFVPKDIVDSMVFEKRYIITQNEWERIQGKLWVNPRQFSYDYALQIIGIGHLFDSFFIQKLEIYVQEGKELNSWKNLVMEWAVVRKIFNPDNTSKYYHELDKTKKIHDELKEILNETLKKYAVGEVVG